ncbi:MAG: stage II sporulation protein E [Clostridium sp.]
MYKEELMPYNRIKGESIKENIVLKDVLTINSLFFYTCAFFASRVVMMKMFMPFGLAFFIAAYGLLGFKRAVVTGIVTMIGYVSMLNGYLGVSHAVVILVLMVVGIFIRKNDSLNTFRMCALAFGVNLISCIFVNYQFVSGSIVLYDVLISLFECGVVVAFGFIFSYGAQVSFFKKTKSEITNEEMICLSLMIAIAVAGTYDIQYMGASLKNIFGFTIAIVCGFQGGAALGAAMGITLGLVSGMADTTMPLTIGIFGFCGLISGVFRDFGKIFTAVTFVLSAAILSFYTSSFAGMQPVLLDSIIGAALFFIIPNSKIAKFSVFNNQVIIEEKKEVRGEVYSERVNTLISNRLTRMTSAIDGLSTVLEKSYTNELYGKADITSMVEQLADKVCFSCDKRNSCWDNELYYTSNAFVELLGVAEKKGKLEINDIPKEIQKKCLRPSDLTRQTNTVFEVFRINSRWRSKIANSRLVLAEQLRGVSDSVNSMVNEALSTFEIKSIKGDEIKEGLANSELSFSDVFAMKNQRNIYEVTIYVDANLSSNISICNYINVVSDVLGVKMCTANYTGASVDNSILQIRLTQEENYAIKTAVARASADEVSGDSYTFGDLDQGRYLVGLSDGMGCGSYASNESKTTIALLEKFMEAGFDRTAAIKAINSVLILGDAEERFATIDMAVVDLYNGIGEFVKIGCAPTYIKTRNGVDTIESTTMPVGILDQVDFESHIVEVENGDMIVMVSDGVTDADTDINWVKRCLSEYDSGNPKDVADHLLKMAKSYVGDRESDDMTVIVSKVWKIV